MKEGIIFTAKYKSIFTDISWALQVMSAKKKKKQKNIFKLILQEKMKNLNVMKMCKI